MCSNMDELRNAVKTNDVKNAKLILQNKKNIDLNGQFRSKCCKTTLLMLACERGCVDMVKLLTTKRKRPADVNIPDSDGRYPISVAVEYQYMKLLAFLLEINANPNVRCNYEYHRRHVLNYTTPLTMACSLGDIDIVKLLIENKANVNLANNEGECPIWVAVKNENLELAAYLLRHTDATPNIHVKALTWTPSTRYSNGLSTTLMEVCKQENVDMVRLLVENKADINMGDGDDVRPVSIAMKTKTRKLHLQANVTKKVIILHNPSYRL